MKKLLAILLMTAGFTGHAQDWVKYKFDENLTLEVPSNFEVIDTLGQHFVRSVLDNEIILVQRLANEGLKASRVETKKDLLSGYEDFTKGIADSQKGTILKQMNHAKGEIVYSEVSMRAYGKIEYMIIVFLNDNWYAIQFWVAEGEMGDPTDVTEPDRERFFSSIEFPAGATEKNQLSITGSHSYKFGYLLGSILMSLIFLLILGLMMYFIFGRRKKHQQVDLE